MEELDTWLTPAARFFRKSLLSLLILAGMFAGVTEKALGQEKGRQQQLDLFLKEGKTLWREGDYDNSYLAFRRAQKLADSLDILHTWAYCTQKCGEYLVNQSRFEEAGPALDSVIALRGKLDSMDAVIFFARKWHAYMDLMQNDIATALKKYQRLSADCERILPPGDSLTAMSYEILSQAEFYNGELQNGLETCQKALAIYQAIHPPDHMAIGTCMNTVAIMHMYLDHYDEALANYLGSVEITSANLGPHHPRVIQVKTNIGVLYAELGLFWKSLAYHRDNLPYLDSLPPLPHLNGLLNMGETLNMVGDYDEAKRYIDLAEVFLNKHPNLSPSAFAYIDLQRSIITKNLGDQESALRYANQSLEKEAAMYGEDHPNLLTQYLQKGQLHTALSQYEEAEKAFRKVVSLARKHIGPTSSYGAHGLYNLAELKAEKGNFREAIPIYKQVMDLYVALGNPSESAAALIATAMAWRELGNWDSTLVNHQRAWQALIPEVPFSLSPGEDVSALWTRNTLVPLLEEQGKSLQWRHSVTGSEENLLAALAAYERSLAIVDSQRKYYEGNASRQTLVGTYLRIYEAGISAATSLYRHTRESDFLKRAFSLAEQSKANSLRDHLRGIQALQFAGIPDSLIEKERYYRQRLAAVDESAFEGDLDSLEQVALLEKRFELIGRYRSLLEDLERDFPRYYELKFQGKAFSFAGLVKKLSPTQAMYSYFWQEDSLYIFRLFQEALTVHHVPIDSVFSQQLTQWLAFASQPPSRDRTYTGIGAAGAALREILLPGLNDGIEQVVCIPDGKLGYLAFESLLQTVPANEDFREWPFLGKDLSFTYAYSGELWLRDRPDQKGKAEYYGFAPNFEGEQLATVRAELGNLAFNMQEVSDIANLLNGTSYTGPEAREELVKSLGPNPVILHFATHALADDQHQLQSRLFFSQDSSQKGNGELNVYEIYGLSLNCPLTVLSACQTGKGPLLRGEGIMSLARAFQYAGSDRVLTTLWKTDDRASAFLTTAFFTGLKNGMDSEFALRDSRRQWIQESDNYHSHPYFWAGYVLVGEGGSIPLKGKGIPLWIIALGAMLLIAGLFLWLPYCSRRFR